ncbi:MAG TPA: hypothetical protein PLS49_03935, partial [Candidatus Woesebacteria bacterium]|nr:hypothetical protein [Candidatus Woesebacteria bacterium]
GSTLGSATQILSNDIPLKLGAWYHLINSNYKTFKGQIDEVKISNTSRSAAWIAAEYKSDINQFINYSGASVIPAGQSLNLSNTIGSGENGKSRLFGTISTGKDGFVMTSVECSPNGAGYGRAVATDGAFDSMNEEFYYDFLSTDGGWTGDGYTIVCRALRGDGVILTNYLYFTPFTQHTPDVNATVYDNTPSFSFSVVKQANVLRNALTKYQIQVKRTKGGVWINHIDNIPVNQDNGFFENDNLRMTVTDNASTLQVESKMNELSGAYIWRVVAVDKAGHTIESATRHITVQSGAIITEGFPLAILNISGLGNPNISSINPTEIKEKYTTYSTDPVFYGIANVGAKITLYLTDEACETKTPGSADCYKIYTTNANAESRFGINIPKGDLSFGNTYTTIISAELENRYTELPPFNLLVGGNNFLPVKQYITPSPTKVAPKKQVKAPQTESSIVQTTPQSKPSASLLTRITDFFNLNNLL